MTGSDPFVWLRVRLATVWAAIRALKEQSMIRHQEARIERADRPERAAELNAEGDHLDDVAEELRAKVTNPEEPDDERNPP